MKLTTRELKTLAMLIKFPPHVWIRGGDDAHVCASLCRKGLAERYSYSEHIRGEARVVWQEYRATALGRDRFSAITAVRFW